MPDDQIPPEPDDERHEPRVRDDRDPGQGPPIDDEESPAIGVLDDDSPEVPEPNEPG